MRINTGETTVAGPPHSVRIEEKPFLTFRPTSDIRPRPAPSSAFWLSPTRPYFSRPNIEQPFYDLSDKRIRNAPQTPDPIVEHFHFEYEEVPLELDAVASTTYRLPSGELFRQPAVIVPRISVSLSPSVSVLPLGQRLFKVAAQVRGKEWDSRTGVLSLLLPDGSKVESNKQDTATQKNVDVDTTYVVESSAISDRPTIFKATATEKLQDFSKDYSEGYRAVGYPGIPYTNDYTPATTRVVPVDVTTAPGLNIAYLPGTGDNVPASLEDLGVHAHLLAPADLTAEKLKGYDAVVLGVRAYEAHPELAAANAALNAYAAAGGVVIAQYNTGRLPEGTGPYPLDLGPSEKVVEETAPVRILAPADPLLNWPNRITPADFDHWVEERGHGFMSTWDSHYTALLETHDAGQKPQLGGLLYTRTGKGAWIYLGLALYRQLPEGVPGSYRLFANLLSATKNPALQTAAKPAP